MSDVEYPLFKPAPDGWHVERRGEPGVITVIVARKSPWCGEHFEGLSDRLMGPEFREEQVGVAINGLKRQITWNSTGWGCCKSCNPDAEFSFERAAMGSGGPVNEAEIVVLARRQRGGEAS